MLALPIDEVLPDVLARVAETRRLVLQAPPGAGKTTRVPRALLDAGYTDRGEVWVLEPRRIAARMAAARVAEELDERLGERVGYRVRFEDVGSAHTRIRFVTEGILTRRLVSDPQLVGVACVLLDEFHERHLHCDIALALLRELQRTTRPDLVLVAMSATLDASPVAQYLDAPIVTSEGARFDVRIDHAPKDDERPIASQVSSALRSLLDEGVEGDVLVFLPGAGEIRRTLEACERLRQSYEFDAVPLHGELSPKEQDAAVRPGPRRKVVLSTNVAESSVTIVGVTSVIDAGLVRSPSFAPWSGLPRLSVVKASRASCIQRAGRAGRMRAGRCIRLFTKADFDQRPAYDLPEIQRSELSTAVLELLAMGHRIETLPWLDPPREDAMRAAYTLLSELGATEGSGAEGRERGKREAPWLTDLGRRMLRWGMHPRLGRLLVEAEARGCLHDACIAAAVLSEGDPRIVSRPSFTEGGRGRASSSQASEDSDVVALVDLYKEADASGFSAGATRALGLEPRTLSAIRRSVTALERMGGSGRRTTAAQSAHDADRALQVSILAGYTDRVARRTRPGGATLALAGGGSAQLDPASLVRHAPWLVCLEVEERKGVEVRLASGIEPEWLLDFRAADIEEVRQVTWNAQDERVEARTALLYRGLALSEGPASPTDEEAADMLAAQALAKGLHHLAKDGGFGAFRARAAFARTQDERIPELDDAALQRVVRTMAQGLRRMSELRAMDLVHTLRGEWGPLAARVDALAPERIALPSGRSAAVHYEAGKPPWAESHLQDFFGQRTTPRVGEGRVPLTLHLLAPNKRAVQVTQDLEGFWERHYPAVRKELMRKYPRHFWPESPLEAEPKLRVARKG